MEKRSPVFGNRSQISDLKFQMGCLSVIAVLSLAFTFSLPGTKKGPKGAVPVRKAAVAGGFYPGNKADLEKLVDALLAQAGPPAIKEPLRAIMVPHAGYVFSGPIAAYAYKELEGRDVRTVVLIGNSHRHNFAGIALYAKGAFETPLGLVSVDEAFAAKLLAADPAIQDRPEIHEDDHVLEVLLPFLQRVLKDFQIVPVLFGGDTSELARKFADTLSPLVNDKVLIVASADMSHYPPYAEAVTSDRKILAAIESGKTEALDATLRLLKGEGVPQAETFLCSPSGVRVAMLLAQNAGDAGPVLLKYANSGDSPAGDKSRVVGYGALAFVAKKNAPAAPNAPKNETSEEENVFSPKEQEELLGIARATVESYVRTGKAPAFAPASAALKQPLGTFVTLKKNGQLRGCIGRFDASGPLYKTVQQMAVSAATQDPRFTPVRAGELPQMEYEISVLSPLRKVPNADAIVLGKHGVTISKGFHYGVFLPQVATETGWSKEEFLSELCSQKAGLPRDCWEDPKTTLQIFTANVFSEKK